MFVNGKQLHLIHPNTVLVELIEPGGEVSGGLVAARHSKVPPIMGVIIDCSMDVVVGGELMVDDVVIFRPHATEEFEYQGKTFNIMHTANIVAVIDGYFEENISG